MASRRREFSITIPADIITEILYRLPAKSIGRFRCVSKSWLSQLTDPKIIKIHLNNTFSQQNHLIFTTSYIEGSSILHSHPFHSRKFVKLPTKLDLQLNSDPYSAEVCGSCDGLVLFCVLCEAHLGETMVVMNPTTKECLRLPEEYYNNFSVTNNIEYKYMGSLYGIGYDSVTDDYKVVSLAHCSYVNDDGDFDQKGFIDVYSLRNKKWRRVTDTPYGTPKSCVVVINGFIHWIVTTEDDDDLLGIAAFSLADECSSKIPFPRFCNTLKWNDCELLVLGGKLAIFINSAGGVWLMNEYGVRESWTNIILHGIDKVPIFKSNYNSKPSVFDENGKIVVANRDRMMVYEVEKATFTETVCAWNPEVFTLAGCYLESLVSPKLGKEEEEDDDNDAQDENEEDEESKEEDDGYDSWKAKHREEKLRADRLEEALNHALSKQESKLVEIQALERRTMEQKDEIESLKARLALLTRRGGRQVG